MLEPLKPVYLLAGSDQPKVRRALARLRARFGEDAVELLTAQASSGEDAVGACNALGLFAHGGRLVVVDAVERWKGADVRAIARYLEDPTPGTVLALIAEGLKRDSPLAKACAKKGDILVYDVSRRELPRWVRDQFTRVGVEADADVSRALVEIVGDDLYALANEVEKIGAWAGGEPIDERTVELLAAPHAEAPLFALTDAWGARDRAGILRACEAALDRSGDPSSSRIARIIGSLTGHVTRVARAHALAAAGVRARDAASELDVRHPYAAEKAFAHARNYSAEELQDVIVRLAALDLALKGAGRIPARLELERTLVEMTEPRDSRAPTT